MHKSIYFFSILCTITTFVNCIEYIYPIGSINENHLVFLIHQKSPISIELLIWDTENNSIIPGLWSLFNPAGFQLLPQKNGFSFIDNDRIKIKFFDKRSPKSIDLSLPLSHLSILHWIDMFSCYGSVLWGYNFIIAQIYNDGGIDVLASSKGKDYLYPQKVNNTLFFIERERSKISQKAHYSIVKMDINDKKYVHIIDFNTCSICFLNAISDATIFVIEHVINDNEIKKNIDFIYYKITQNDDCIWKKKRLFNFTIPASLLYKNSKDSLYESLLPLQPCVYEDIIYFVDNTHSKKGFLEIYAYDMHTNLIKKIAPIGLEEKHFFVPFLCNKKFICGGSGSSQKDLFIF